MTRKENLLLKKYELENVLASLKGQELFDIDSYKSSWRFEDEARGCREQSLRDSVTRLEAAIAYQRKINEVNEKTEAYYQTEEGFALKELLESQREELRRRWQEYDNKTSEALNQFIQDVCGSHWAVRRYHVDGVEFSVYSENDKDFVFGQNIEVSCKEHDRWFDDKECFKTNIGTTGSFDIEERNPGDRARFYIDLGKFLSHDLSSLKRIIFDYYDTHEEFLSAIKQINDRLENPLGIIY